MSFFAQAWAETASVANVYERAILTLLAHRAPDKDGCGSHPGVPSLAEFAVCSHRQVQNVLAALRERKVIAYGDEDYARKIPKALRPQVYDLMIPYSYFSPTTLAEVNQERERIGKGPLTAEERPDIVPVEPKPAGRREATPKRPALKAVRTG